MPSGIHAVAVGIVGCGHWGRNYVRVMSELAECRLIAFCDIDSAKLNEVSRQHPAAKTYHSFPEMLGNPEIEALVIATHASSHYALARAALSAGKDVLCEKPLAVDVREAETLTKLAEQNGRILMVGHTFLYNRGIHKVKELIRAREIGDIFFLKTVRSHLGLVREDVNVCWDLASHDLSILNYLLEASPLKTHAVGSGFFKQGREDVAFITLEYPKNILANVHVSWADSNKQRTVEVVGSKGRIVFDDLNTLEPVRLYKRGTELKQNVDGWGDFKHQFRDGDIVSPKVEMREPLKEQCRHFFQSFHSRIPPLTDGRSGLEIVRIMAEIDETLAKNRVLV